MRTILRVLLARVAVLRGIRRELHLLRQSHEHLVEVISRHLAQESPGLTSFYRDTTGEDGSDLIYADDETMARIEEDLTRERAAGGDLIEGFYGE